MPRARTGTLIYKRSSGWNARVWVTVNDSTTGVIREERRWVPLDTHDRELARRKLAKIVDMLSRGEIVADAVKAKAKAVETVREAKEAFIARRKAAGVVMATDEERWLNDYVLASIGELPVTQVRSRDIKAILDASAMKLSAESIRKLRGTMHRMFKWLWQAETIVENPVERVALPADARVDERPRTMLTDAQVLVFLNARASGPNEKKPRSDAEERLLEIKVIAVCARVLGGLRTAEVNRWSWDMVVDREVDVQTFETVRVRRAKAKRGHVGKLQKFIVPEPMRPILGLWHQLHGAPLDGPVFPVTKGDRKGAFRSVRGTSYAKRLRRELWRAGVREHVVHYDTPSSRKVDFHSFRRAFATSLAEAGINEQRAMMLTAHTDSRVHQLYVQETAAMQAIPAAAVPVLPSDVVFRTVTAVTDAQARLAKASEIRRARRDSNPRPAASKADEAKTKANQ